MRAAAAGIAAAVAVTAAGCSVPVAGNPTVAPPVPPLRSSASADPTAPERLNWTRVTDGATGTTLEMPAPANPEEKELPNGDPALPVVKATVYQAATTTSGTVQLIIITREPNGVFDLAREVSTVVDQLRGTLSDDRPVTVDGHPGVDYTVTYTAESSGRPAVVHTRFVEAKAFAIRLTTRGVGKDPAAVAAVHERVAASLRVPAP